MLRFPYRRVWMESRPEASSTPWMWFSSWIRKLFTVKPTPTPVAKKSVENPPRPIVSIRIRGPVAARSLKSALLDTGSQDTLFPAAFAEPLGILLGGARHSIKWRGLRYWVEFHTVELELAQNQVVCWWQARVGFTPAPLAYAILGQRGSLEFLDATFFGADQFVELSTNRLFPGTIVPAV